jgi:hypothetical protein
MRQNQGDSIEMSGAQTVTPFQPPPGLRNRPPVGSTSTAQDTGTNASSTIIIPVNTEQQTQIIRSITAWQNSQYTQYSLRTEMENIDRIYMREKDWTEDQVKSRLANRKGDSRQIQNVTVPIVMPQVNSCLTYLSDVYLTGYPIFPVVADPSNEDAALQLETIIQENAVTAGWAHQLGMFFRDGLKYNLHAIECDWKQRANWTVQNDLSKANNAGARKILWEGNVLKRMDLYNTFWDPRVHPSEVHLEGEFIGYTEVYSRIRFKKYCNSLYNMAPKSAVIAALNSQPIQGAIGASTTAPFGYYIPAVNPYPFYNKSANMDWLNWASNTPTSRTGVNYVNAYSITTVYARILPDDYGFTVPERNTPQVWKFVIVNGAVVLTAERLTNIHNFLPIFVGQPIEDGLDYQTKSFATNVADMQDICSGLWNGHIASKRRLVGDRVLYDPSRVNQRDINSDNPAAKIPVRPSAYGKPMSEAVYQFPFRDEQTDSLVQSSNLVVAMANLINGQNPAQQGQFVKGNKTRHEYADVQGHSNGQNQQIALSIEYQVLVPMKEVLKLNTLQYQGAKTIYNTGRGKQVNVSPEDLRKSAVHFKVADGLIPTDKITGDDLLQTVIQQFGSSPQLAAGYNIADAFTYLMKTQGLDLTPFAKSQAQLQYEQAIQAWQQAAQEAAKAGAPFSSPQPQPSPALQQEMQQKQQGMGGTSNSTPTTAALEATQS